VLVVDDEPLIRWSLAQTLAGSGCTIMEAGDARSAIQAVQASLRPIDVILLDFRLPDSDDLSLLSRLRELTSASRIILMTAFLTPELAQAASDLGASEVLSKPFELVEVARLVRGAA
jgi:DNA-binding NtrC family response regulator